MRNIEYKAQGNKYSIRAVNNSTLYRLTKKGYIRCIEALVSEEELINILLLGSTPTLVLN